MAQRGYFRIKENKKNDYSLIKNVILEGGVKRRPIETLRDPIAPSGRSRMTHDPRVSLSDYEQKIIDLIFEDGMEVKIKDIKLYTIITDIRDKITNKIIADQYLPDNFTKTQTFYYIIAALAGVSLNFVLLMMALIFGRNMPAKTFSGAVIANKAKGLRNFLKSQSRQLTFQAKEQYWFEKLLPYSVSFLV